MPNLELPKIDRRIPKAAVFFISIIFYLIIVPLNWVITKLGFGPKFISSLHKRQLGKGGAEKVFDGYTPTEHDVFVSTFAKSGTNWMMQIAHQVSFHGDGEYEHIHDVVSWPDLAGKMSEKVSIPLSDELVQQASPEKLRVIKTHLSALNVPYSDKAKYIVVIRDPKEVFVSSYHFVGGSFGPIMPSSDVWFDLFLSKEFPLNFGNTWAEHTASYWALKDKPNVLVLSYTKMKKDLEGTVQQVSDFLGATLTQSEFLSVVEKSSFQYMKNIDDKFLPIPRGTFPWGEFTMMRQGKTGQSDEMISKDRQALIDTHFQQELKNLQSDFPYSEFCKVI